MLDIELARNRIELYLRLPAMEPDDLLPLLRASAQAGGIDLLARNFPDGVQRLAGRRLASVWGWLLEGHRR